MPLPGPQTACILKSPTNTQDAQGASYVSAWSNVVTFSGVFQPISAKEAVDYNRLTAISTHYLFVAYSDIKNYIVQFIEPNRIYINSVAYNITGVENFHGHHLEITLKRVL